MKNKKFPSLVVISISLELILSPVPALAESKTQNVMNTMGGLMNLGVTAYDTFRGNKGNGQLPAHVATDMDGLTKQAGWTNDKKFTVNNLQQIPGLMEYVAKKNQDAARSGGKMIKLETLNCKTLPSTLFEANNEVCRNREVNGLAGDPKLQADEAFAYYNQYMQINKKYSNALVKKNDTTEYVDASGKLVVDDGQSFGFGCMEDAMALLKGFFSYRLEQMDTMVAELEAAEAKFSAQSEMDLKAIRESSAILNGEKSTFASEFAKSDIFDYGKRFEDPACNSLIAKDDMDKFGKEGGGLMAIEKKLKGDLTATPAGSKYSPEQYLKNHADVVKDIRKMADKVSDQANLNFSQISNSPEGYSAFLTGIGGDVSSESGANVGLNKAFFSDLQTKFAKTRNSLTDEVRLISSEIGGKSSEAIKQLANIDSDTNFDAEVSSLENQIKGECVNNSGIDNALSRIYDPGLSKSANKHSAAQIQKRIKAIIEDIKISPENKLSQLKEIEAQGGSRYEMKMDADYETQEIKADGSIVKKKVNAAGKVTPGSFFTDIIKNCESQFQVNKLNNKLSAKEAIKKLRTLKKDYQKAARQHSKDIKDEIIKKMVDCDGNNAIANSSTVGSCTPAKLDMTGPGFCAKAAFSCSTNMKKCTDKAKKFVGEITADRTTRANNYNNNVESQRIQMVGMFDATLVKYMKEAESLRGMFGIGFVPPKDITRDIKNGSQFMSEAPYAPADQGDKFDLKDPKKYLAMIKGNMANLRKQVEGQQQGIMSEDGPFQKHIEDTKKNYKDQVISKTETLAKDCLAAYNSYKTLVAEQKKAYDKVQGELGEKTNDFCGRYEDVMVNHVAAGCKDGVGDVSDEMIKAASQAGNAWTAAEAKRMRGEMQVYCNAHGNQRDKDGNSKTSAAVVCAKASHSANQTEKDIAIKALESVALNGMGWKDVCNTISSNTIYRAKLCEPDKAVTSASGNTTGGPETFNCTSVDGRIAAAYDVIAGNNGAALIVDIENPAPPQSNGDTSSFCNASNNSGPFNTKGNMLQGGNNPMAGQSGAAGFQH